MGNQKKILVQIHQDHEDDGQEIGSDPLEQPEPRSPAEVVGEQGCAKLPQAHKRSLQLEQEEKKAGRCEGQQGKIHNSLDASSPHGNVLLQMLPQCNFYEWKISFVQFCRGCGGAFYSLHSKLFQSVWTSLVSYFGDDHPSGNQAQSVLQLCTC